MAHDRYLRQSLITDEVLVAAFDLHWLDYLRLWFYAFMAVVVIGGLGPRWQDPVALYGGSLLLAVIALMALREWLRLRGTEIGVTSLRLVRKTGVVSRVTEEMQLDAIETVEIEQGLVGRLFKYGTVKVTGRGQSGVLLAGVKDPVAVKKHIEEALRLRRAAR
ncbi:MAG: hypothetical protein RL026_99 [Pseudomonadota bacterium]|jgi:uncharacterized membrane protein YdbT with pleckstrin-like domain